MAIILFGSDRLICSKSVLLWMGFGIHALVYHMGQGENYPHIQRYVAGLSQLPSWQAAVQVEQNGVKSQK